MSILFGCVPKKLYFRGKKENLSSFVNTIHEP